MPHPVGLEAGERRSGRAPGEVTWARSSAASSPVSTSIAPAPRAA
ncbi:hypothetical protein ON003_06235 [Janibacter hoylei]|nr:hypothetical protein [Janibacter hoylei]MCW4601234.1 hypothetical protein [Janibacter hoylei]